MSDKLVREIELTIPQIRFLTNVLGTTGEVDVEGRAVARTFLKHHESLAYRLWLKTIQETNDAFNKLIADARKKYSKELAKEIEAWNKLEDAAKMKTPHPLDVKMEKDKELVAAAKKPNPLKLSEGVDKFIRDTFKTRPFQPGDIVDYTMPVFDMFD